MSVFIGHVEKVEAALAYVVREKGNTGRVYTVAEVSLMRTTAKGIIKSNQTSLFVFML